MSSFYDPASRFRLEYQLSGTAKAVPFCLCSRTIQGTGEDVRAYIVKDASPAQFMSCLGPVSNNVGVGLRPSLMANRQMASAKCSGNLLSSCFASFSYHVKIGLLPMKIGPAGCCPANLFERIPDA